jgi:phage gp36-like protein
MQIKNEIIRLLTSPTEWYTSFKLIRAEQTAIKQIRHRIGKRYNCNFIFAPTLEAVDIRDEFIVTITIDIALYHLYSQTGIKDIPEHRQQRYQDALDWLRDVGNGTTSAELPEMIDETTGEEYSDFRFNSRTPENQKW